MPNTKILSDEERKDILFELVQAMSWGSFGAAATHTSLSLVYSVGKGHYFEETSNSGIAKEIKSENPGLYDKLQVFFHQNRPEDWNNDEDE